MPKGVKYNLFVNNPRDEKKPFEFFGLYMKELIETSENTIKENYNIELKITRNKIYNVMNRPNTVSPLISGILTIEKC